MQAGFIKETKVDVLVIGAGPAGLFASNALARAGVNVKVIDQRPIKVAAGQADGIQPRTIEVLQSYGLAERLIKEGNEMHLAAFYNPSPKGGIELSERVADSTAPTARYPFEVTLHQGAIESIFLDSMAENNIYVDRPYVPLSIELSQDETLLKDPQAYPVKVIIKRLNSSNVQEDHDVEFIHAKFVIGADGAHSWVRGSLGIAMEGEQTDFIWGVIDLTPETNFPDIRNKSVIHSDNGSCMVIPREGDKVRLYIQLSETDAVDGVTGRVDKNRVQGPHKLLEVARKSFVPYTIETPEAFEWWTIYKIGQRVASKFSVNERVFIVGDACHTHSPKAGQGMNASMNDSHNLVWKIAHVLRGWADISLLKTYELERRKYAQDLINFDKKFAKLFSGKPRTKDKQDGVSHEEFLEAFQTFGGFTTGIGIHYSPSTITAPSSSSPSDQLNVDMDMGTDTGSTWHVNGNGNNVKLPKSRPQYHGHQGVAKNLIIGQRILPQIFLRAADGKPIEIQDLLPSDTRFKILVFTGDSDLVERQELLKRLALDMKDSLQSFVSIQRNVVINESRNGNGKMNGNGKGNMNGNGNGSVHGNSGKGDGRTLPLQPSRVHEMFDILAIDSTTKEKVKYTSLPTLFRSHWSKVLIDDSDTRGQKGGNGYSYYGIDPNQGAIVIIRPDGYIATIISFENVKKGLEEYFSGFMVKYQ